MCTLVALAAAIGLPRVSALVDRLAVRGAVAELAAACAAARQLAILRGQPAVLVVDDAAGQLTMRVGADTVVRRPVGHAFGVTLSATRDSLVYAPTGLGFGAANLRVAVTRRAVTDTLFVSRLGRVRR